MVRYSASHGQRKLLRGDNRFMNLVIAIKWLIGMKSLKCMFGPWHARKYIDNMLLNGRLEQLGK